MYSKLSNSSSQYYQICLVDTQENNHLKKSLRCLKLFSKAVSKHLEFFQFYRHLFTVTATAEVPMDRCEDIWTIRLAIVHFYGVCAVLSWAADGCSFIITDDTTSKRRHTCEQTSLTLLLKKNTSFINCLREKISTVIINWQKHLKSLNKLYKNNAEEPGDVPEILK